jgi:hypothetical protein
MLSRIRQASNHFLFKIVMLLIVASFVAWGLSDMVKSRREKPVVKIKHLTDITAQDLQRQISVLMGNMNSGFRRDANRDSKELQLMAIQTLLDERMLYATVDDLNIKLSNEKVVSYLQDLFDTTEDLQDHLRQAVKQYHMSEDQYLDLLNKALSYDLWAQALNMTTDTSDFLVKLDYALKQERRQANLFYIAAQDVAITDKPTEEQLLQVYNSNADNFTIPELRDLSYVILKPSDLTARGMHPEKKRSIRDMLNDIDDAFAAGASLEQIASEYKLDIHKLIRVKQHDRMLVQSIPEFDNFLPTAFELRPNEVSALTVAENNTNKAIGSQYFLIRVDNIYPAMLPQFDQISSEVESLWQQQEKQNLQHQYASEILQQLSLSNMDMVQQKYNFIRKDRLTVDKKSNNPVVRTVFDLQEGDSFGPIAVNMDELAIGILTDIIPTQNKPTNSEFDAVKEQVENENAYIIQGFYKQYIRQKYPYQINL